MTTIGESRALQIEQGDLWEGMKVNGTWFHVLRSFSHDKEIAKIVKMALAPVDCRATLRHPQPNGAFHMKGGKREGAGRPAAPPRPMPISWRPDTQAQRDKWLELGGARWVKRLLDEAIEKEPMTSWQALAYLVANRPKP